MYRYAIEDLKEWLNEEEAKPLVLRGARQVGKSTLVRILCEQEKVSLIEINLEKQKLKQLEDKNNFSIQKVVNEIELLSKKKISKNSVIFLDEIQAQPIALSRLRYFYEDRPDLKVIAAGSLLEVVMEKHNFPMPVGRVDYYHLGPMSFTEFILAMDKQIILEQLNGITIENPPTETLHNELNELLKEYYFVGGMPGAIKYYIQKKDIESARKIHLSLIQTFRDDIPKYTKDREGKRVLDVFEYTPFNLGNKVVFSDIAKDHSSFIKKAVDLLSKAGIIYKVVHSNCSGIPLSAGKNEDVYKLFFLDIGLYNAMLGTQWQDIYNLPPSKLLINGNMAEQFMAQHLTFLDPRTISPGLNYWLRGGKKNSAEVDFVISHHGNIYPIEVKAGSTGKIRSAWQFVAEKNNKLVVRFDLALRDQLISEIRHKIKTKFGISEISCQLLSLPLYSVERIYSLLTQLDS